MPTFDVTSEVDLQEVRNAVDQARREISTRFDFKGTGSSVELGEGEMIMSSISEDRLKALRQVLEEKLVRRQVSLKAVSYGDVQDAAGGTVRQVATLNAGISKEKAKAINAHIKEMRLKGVSSQLQGDRIRVSGKKRDDLQTVISSLKEKDFGIPLQFGNFRD